MKALIALSVAAIFTAATAFGQKDGPIPNGPVVSCWNPATAANFAQPVGAAIPSCGVGQIRLNNKADVTINCNKVAGGSACDYCIRIYFEKKVGGVWVADPAGGGGEQWGGDKIACVSTKVVPVDKETCQIKGQTRRFIIKVYDKPCGTVDDTTPPAQVLTSLPYIVPNA